MLNVCEASLGLIGLPSAVTLCRQRDSSLTLRMTKGAPGMTEIECSEWLKGNAKNDVFLSI